MSDNVKDIVFETQLTREVSGWNVRDDLKGLSVPELNSIQPKIGYAVALVNVDGGLNIGTMIRSAVLFGADKVYVIGKRRFDIRSCVGSQNYIDIDRIYSDFENVDDIFTAFARDDYYPVACETGGNIQVSEVGLLTRPVFLFGSESDGIPLNVLSRVSNIVTIRQIGIMRSLNVSVAAGIIMQQFASQMEM